ncbi:MAG: hypothetical protein E7460_05835 [Ruminococcaceae bacterium]|nr:hypothetical protein [Oscillospiraceae bacterium]
MKLDPKILKLAKEKHSAACHNRRSAMMDKLEDLRQRVPEFAALEKSQFRLGAEIAEACLSGDPEATLAAIRPRAEAIAQRKEAILTANGLPPSGEAEIACTLCGDEGFTGGRPCSCLMSFYRDEQFKENARLFRFVSGDRRDFLPGDYSEEPNPKNRGIPDRAYMIRLLEKLETGGDIPAQSIAFTGESGMGKKFLTAFLLRRAIAAGEFCVYAPAYSLAKLFEEDRFSRSEYASDELERMKKASLLIIDELGTEQTTAYSVAALLELLDQRFSEGLTTVITTGLDEKDISVRYNPELVLRLYRQFTQYFIPLTVAEAERNNSYN